MSRRQVWGYAAYFVLFRRLCKSVGAHSTWAHRYGPGHGLEHAYSHACRSIADALLTTEGDVIREVEEAIESLELRRKTRGLTTERATAAIESGFLFDPRTGSREN
jgi:hypothetical protein